MSCPPEPYIEKVHTVRVRDSVIVGRVGDYCVVIARGAGRAFALYAGRARRLSGLKGVAG